MADESLTRKTPRELAAMIKARAVSPVEVLDAHLAVIARVNPKLNAIVTLAAEQANDNARAVEAAVMRGERLGALAGLPVAIKDVTPTAGIRTTFGSPLYKDHVPEEDAEAVSRLKAAGAIVLAKTNTPEFATGANTVNALFGVTRNPWNCALSPAGSSGGSAVAVATGMVPIAQGTDFGCSIRIPAAFCGIVGIRPTPGVTPTHPAPFLWAAGQVHGPLARTAEDAALVLDAMIGLSRFSPISVAPPWPSVFAQVDRCKDARGLRIAYVSDSGAIVEEFALDASDVRAPYKAWRGAWMLGRQFTRLSRAEEFGENLKGNVKAVMKVTPRDLAPAEHVRQQLFHRFRELFERFDLLLTPAAPVKPYPVEMNFPNEINGRKFDNYIDWIAPAFLITLVSLPAGSVAAGLTHDGLPVGLQIVAPRFEEP